MLKNQALVSSLRELSIVRETPVCYTGGAQVLQALAVWVNMMVTSNKVRTDKEPVYLADLFK